MSQIKSKKFAFDDPAVDADKVKSFNIYYVKDGTVNYTSPKISIPAVPGQITYEVDIPAQVPIGEGQYELGASAVDESGNESDITVLDSFFDFTAPAAPLNLRVE